MKPTIGQKVYSLNIGNAARNAQPKLTEMTVTKVGRKYFTVSRGGSYDIQFHIEGWRQKTNFCQDHKLYPTEQAYLDESEAEEICERLYSLFEYGRNSTGLSLKKLRKLVNVVYGGGDDSGVSF